MRILYAEWMDTLYQPDLAEPNNIDRPHLVYNISSCLERACLTGFFVPVASKEYQSRLGLVQYAIGKSSICSSRRTGLGGGSNQVEMETKTLSRRVKLHAKKSLVNVSE